MKVKHPAVRRKWLTKHIVHDYFSICNLNQNPERFVLVGFIAADGCICVPKSGQKRLQFNLSEKDLDVLRQINIELAAGTRNISRVKKTKSCIWYVPSDPICEDLSRYNIVPRKTRNYKLPKLQEPFMSYFLRGYFYGDGCVSGNGSSRTYSFVATTHFAELLSVYLTENNIVDRCQTYKIKDKECVQIHFKGRQGAKFSQYLFSDDLMKLLPRKHIITEEIVKGSPWTCEEKELVQSMTIDEFCSLSGRSKSAALAMLDKLRYRPHLV